LTLYKSPKRLPEGGSNISPVSKGVQDVQVFFYAVYHPEEALQVQVGGSALVMPDVRAQRQSRHVSSKHTDGIAEQIWSVPLAGPEQNVRRNSPCDAGCAYLIRSDPIPQLTDRCRARFRSPFRVPHKRCVCPKGKRDSELELSFMWIDSWNTQEEI